jgi:hypothetical protein
MFLYASRIKILQCRSINELNSEFKIRLSFLSDSILYVQRANVGFN